MPGDRPIKCGTAPLLLSILRKLASMSLSRTSHAALRIGLVVLAILVAFNASSTSTLRAQTGRDLAFVPNRGQVIDSRGSARTDVLFVAESRDATVYLRSDGMTIVLHRVDVDSASQDGAGVKDKELPRSTATQMHPPGGFDRATLRGHRVDIDFVNAQKPNGVQTGEVRSGVCSYYRNNAPHATALNCFTSVRLANVWQGIDVVIKGVGGVVKYEFVVAPAANPEMIRLRYSGADSIELERDLRISTSLGTIIDAAPVAYLAPPTTTGIPLPVNAAYRMIRSQTGVEIGFDVDIPTDVDGPLIIDPAIIWSTFYGGSSYDFWYDYGGGYGGATAGWSGAGQGMTVDADGNIYVSGGTVSVDFPTTVGAFSRQIEGEMDAYVVSFDPMGNRRWGTLIGGGGTDYCSGVATGSGGVVGISGSTRSVDFPVTPGAVQSTSKGDFDAFVGRLDTAGRLVWATYLGGYDWDFGGGVALASDGGIVVGGSTQGEGLPVSSNVFQTRFAGVTDAFVARFTPGGDLDWLTYAGGSLHDFGSAVAVDRSGRIALTVRTYSHDFPTTAGGFRSGWAVSPTDATEGAVVLLESTGRVVWSTYIGGTDNDYINNLAFDRAGNVYTGGSTVSLDLPTTPGSLQSKKTPGAQLDAWLARFAADGSLQWCTYYGGSGLDAMTTIAAAPNGHLYATGYTRSSDLLRGTISLQPALRGGSDAFVVEFDAQGRLLWDSFLGGGYEDYGTGITGDGSGSVYISGYTRSPDFPTRNPFQPNLDTTSGSSDEYWDIFLSRLCGRLYPIIDVSGATSFCEGDSVIITGPAGYVRYMWMPGGETTRRVAGRNSGRYVLNVWNDVGCDGPSDTVVVTVFPTPTPRISVLGDTILCSGDSVVLKLDSSRRRSHRWSTGSIADSIVVRSAGEYAVEVTDEHGCRGLSQTVRVMMHGRPARPSIWPRTNVHVCRGESVRLTADSTASQVRWNTGERSWSIDATAGAYWCEVINETGCTVRSDTVRVSEYTGRNLFINAPDSVTICQGANVRLVGSDGFVAYSWSTGESSQAIDVQNEGSYSVRGVDSNGCVVDAPPVHVLWHRTDQPILQVSGSLTLCDGDSVALSVRPGPFQRVLWNTGEAGERIVVRRPAHVYATVETMDGCLVTTNALDISTIRPPYVDVAGPVSVCDDAIAYYSVPRNQRVHYTWTIDGDGDFIGGGQKGSDVAIKWGRTSGRVTVHALDTASGCDTTISFEVTTGERLHTRVAMSHRTSCPDVGVILDAGGGFVEYRWSTGDSSRTITAVPGGAYWVDLLAPDGCRGRSDTVFVPQGVLPRPVIARLGETTFCDGDSVVLDAGDGYASYLWCDGSRGRFLVARVSGAFNVEVTDRSGCVGISEPVAVVALPRPNPRIAGPATVCAGSTARYDVDAKIGSQWTWRVMGGRILSGQSTASIVVQWGGAGGTLAVVARNPDGCEAQARTMAISIADSITPWIRPGNVVPICDGDSVVLDAGTGYVSYRWSTGDSTSSIVVTRPGNYTLSVTDSGNCVGGSTDVEVFSAPSPTPIVTAQGSTLLPRRGAVVLDAGFGYASYLWSTGARTRSIVVRDTGIYTVLVVDSNGCIGLSDRTLIRDDTASTAKRSIRIAVGSILARPGARASLPILVTGTDGALIGVTKITADLRFDASMLIPVAPTARGRIDGVHRSLPIALGGLEGDSTIFAFPFVAAVGNATGSPIEITNIEVVGSDAPVDVVFGEVRLDSLCANGGTRFIGAGGEVALKCVGPNPVQRTLNIAYEVVEDGVVRIELIDSRGDLAGVLVQAYHRAGAYMYDADLSSVASGVFRVVLSSGRARVSAPVVVSR